MTETLHDLKLNGLFVTPEKTTKAKCRPDVNLMVVAGILFGMRSFAPMLGFALGAWTNSLYVDLNGNFSTVSY